MKVSDITATGLPVILLPITLPRPHEFHDPRHVQELEIAMLNEAHFTHPISLEAKTLTILDGHHRFRASQALSFNYIPCVLIDYWTDGVSVTAWREGETVTREDVLAAGMSRRLMPIKASRHKFARAIGECRIALTRLCNRLPAGCLEPGNYAMTTA